MAAASLLLVGFAAMKWLSAVEVFGFITGGICVWLVVRQHILNWPIGLVNNVVFFVLFFKTRLYADMSLQVFLFALGVYGWWYWVRRGPDQQPLRPTHTRPWEWLAVAAFIVVATAVIRQISLQAGGVAVFWDALTTALSLAAQYLLGRKRIENWYLWLLADAIYVPSTSAATCRSPRCCTASSSSCAWRG